MSSPGVPSQTNLTTVPPYGEPGSANFIRQTDLAGAFAQRCNTGLGCSVATNSILVTGQTSATIPTLDLSVLVDSSIGAVTLTMPALAAGDHNIEIVKVSSDSNTVTIKFAGSDTAADGTTTFVLYNQNDFVDYLSTSAKNAWAIRGYRQRSIPSNGGFSGLSGSAQIMTTNSGAAQLVPTGTATTVAFVTKVFDNGLPIPYWNSGSPKQFEAPVAGIYEIIANVQGVTTIGVGTINLRIFADGNAVAAQGSICTANNFMFLNENIITQLTSAQTVTAQLYQSSGAGFVLSTINPATLSIVQVG